MKRKIVMLGCSCIVVTAGITGALGMVVLLALAVWGVIQ